MPFVFFDFESQSAISLHKYGSAVYARHPSTRIMSAVFRHEDGTQVVWAPACPFDLPGVVRTPCPPPQIRAWVVAGCKFAAHNCEMFDAMIWKRHLSAQCGTPRFGDTIHQARLCGLPASLDKLLQVLLHKTKADDTAMRVLTAAIYPKGSTVPLYPTGNRTIWAKLIAYNTQDVADLETVSTALAGMNADLPGLLDLHWKINERGLLIDAVFTDALIARFGELSAAAGAKMQAATEGELDEAAMRSPAKVKRYLASIGIALPGDSLNKSTIDLIIANPLDYFDDDEPAKVALAVVVARKDICRAAVGKLRRALSEMDPVTCRVQQWAKFHGAHTGRFSGRGVQPHNFPRDKCDYPKGGDLSGIKDGNKLSGLTRSIIRPTPGCRFFIGDYSAIEARGTAYLAGCKSLLRVFRNDIDPYCHTASILFNRTVTPDDELERQVGKVIVLGCGYQMGPERFEAYCKANRVDLQAANITPKQGVELYRHSYPEVVRFWYDCQRAVMEAVQHGRRRLVGGCIFRVDHTALGALSIELPSGRKLLYHQPRVCEGKFGPQVEYLSERGYYKSLYGGLIVENIVQGYCRDVMCDGMLRAEPVAPVVIHVHDEIGCESARDVREQLQATLNLPPSWATGLPMKIKVFASDMYSKGPVSL